jgi:hypothetical protein
MKTFSSASNYLSNAGVNFFCPKILRKCFVARIQSRQISVRLSYRFFVFDGACAANVTTRDATPRSFLFHQTIGLTCCLQAPSHQRISRISRNSWWRLLSTGPGFVFIIFVPGFAYGNCGSNSISRTNAFDYD